MVLSPTSELHHNRQMNLPVKQTAHNRHYVRSRATPNSAHECLYVWGVGA